MVCQTRYHVKITRINCQVEKNGAGHVKLQNEKTLYNQKHHEALKFTSEI